MFVHGDTLAGRERWKKYKESVNNDHHNIHQRRSSQIPRGTVHLQVLKFDLMIFLVNYSIEKPQPDGLALTFQECKPGQSCDEAVNMAQPGLAYLGLALPGLRPQAGPCTALGPTEPGPAHGQCMWVYHLKRLQVSSAIWHIFTPRTHSILLRQVTYFIWFFINQRVCNISTSSTGIHGATKKLYVFALSTASP